MAVVSRPPTSEIGYLSQPGLVSWSALEDRVENVPELRWPRSIESFTQMRNDSQIDGLFDGIVWPILGFRWYIDPNGAPDHIVTALAEDLLLPIKGQEIDGRPRRKNRFNFIEHLEQALDALVYGHYFFEQVGEIDASSQWRLRKLAPRPPDTITEISVANDGGLVYIKQELSGNFYNSKSIPVDRLVAYTWGKRGAQWTGRSILRSLYRNWLIKDRLMRVDAIRHERNGMGIPVATAPPNPSADQLKQLQAIADQAKVGEAGGAVIPNGSTLKFHGVDGSTPDVVASVIYHDQQMARRLAQMVASLGQQGSTGNRALGETMTGLFDRGLRAIAAWFANVFNSHVVEDYVDWNWAGVDRVPVVTFSQTAEEEIGTTQLAEMVTAGLITVDPELEDWVRDQHGLPPKPENLSAPTGPTTIPISAGRKRVMQTADPTQAFSLPSRKLGRDPYQQEILSKTDWKALDELHDLATATLLAEFLKDVRPAQLDDIELQISKAKSVTDFQNVRPMTTGANVLEKHMVDALELGALGALDEAKRQGIVVSEPTLKVAKKGVRERAQVVASLISTNVGEAAGRKALALSGGAYSNKDIGAMVSAYVGDFSDTWLRDRFGGAISAALNEGRMVVFGQEPATLYASELLDTNTCDACAAVDGTEYSSSEEAGLDYPTGGYRDCAGGDRCRGTVIAVYDG